MPEFRKLKFWPKPDQPDVLEARVGNFNVYWIWSPKDSGLWYANSLYGQAITGTPCQSREAAEALCQIHLEKWVDELFFVQEPKPTRVAQLREEVRDAA